MQTLKVNGWELQVTTDDDGHLLIAVNHEDESTVHDTGEDVSQSETEWASRFSTDKIELDYTNSLVNVDANIPEVIYTYTPDMTRPECPNCGRQVTQDTHCPEEPWEGICHKGHKHTFQLEEHEEDSLV
jgi:hypothetical protein